MLFAVTCPVCGERGAAPCRRCLERLRPAPLLPPPPGVDDCRALLAYEGAGRELVARLKHRNHRAAIPGLARALATLGDGVDVVTWAPTTAVHRRRRGFDQSELLARQVARRLGVPCRPALRRRAGRAQTGRTAAERWSGPSFDVIHTLRGRVALVDDVVTTGATVAAASHALRRAGATAIVVLALARTPLKSTTHSDEGGT